MIVLVVVVLWKGLYVVIIIISMTICGMQILGSAKAMICTLTVRFIQETHYWRCGYVSATHWQLAYLNQGEFTCAFYCYLYIIWLWIITYMWYWTSVNNTPIPFHHCLAATTCVLILLSQMFPREHVTPPTIMHIYIYIYIYMNAYSRCDSTKIESKWEVLQRQCC